MPRLWILRLSAARRQSQTGPSLVHSAQGRQQPDDQGRAWWADIQPDACRRLGDGLCGRAAFRLCPTGYCPVPLWPVGWPDEWMADKMLWSGNRARMHWWMYGNAAWKLFCSPVRLGWRFFWLKKSIKAGAYETLLFSIILTVVLFKSKKSPFNSTFLSRETLYFETPYCIEIILFNNGQRGVIRFTFCLVCLI